jgi:O-antigen/teichoic acid export membrane protein
VLVVLTYVHLVSRVLVELSFDWAQMRHLLLVGLPVALISFSDVFLRSIDGAILVTYYGAERFGLYSVAMQMAAYLFALPQAAGFVIWPRVLEAYGAAGQDGKTQRRVVPPTIAAAGIMPVLAGMAYLAIPPAISLLLPKFSDSVAPAQVLGMGSVLLALPLATNSALVASNREALVIAAKLAGAGLAGGLAWYLVRRSAPLEQIALAPCLGFGLAAVLSLLLQFRDFYPEPAARLREVLLCLLPLGWSLGALWAAAYVAGVMGLPAASVRGALLRMLVFLVLCSPCLLYVHRRTHLGGELLRGLRDGFRR